MKLLIINGPNLNMLGIREPGIYGTDSYESLCRRVLDYAAARGVEAELYQSNHEGDLVDKIQQALHTADGILINPAAYTHTSVAILDALKAVSLPAAEVHLSDVDAREPFRAVSYAGLACLTTCKGRGFDSYREAIDFLVDYLNAHREGEETC